MIAVRALVGPVADVHRHLGPRWGWVEHVRRGSLPHLDPIGRSGWDRPLVREKGMADFAYQADVDPSEIARIVWPTYHRNFLATKKYRVIGGEKQWSVGSWRYVEEPGAPLQHHLYYFPSPSGSGTDLYHHREENWAVDPKGHENEPQAHGDPDGVLAGVLKTEGISYVPAPTVTSG